MTITPGAHTAMPATMPKSNFEAFLARALENPETRAAFEDAQSRDRLVDALVRMRHRLGMTQTQVANRMGVKQPSVSGFETEGSDPHLSTIQRYARSVDAVFVWDLRPRLEATYADAYAPGPRRRQEEVNVNVMSAQHITHDGRPFRVNYVDLTYREDSQLGVQALITGSPITKSGRLSVKVEKVALVSREWPEWLRELARDPDYMPDWFRVPAWLDDEDDPPLDGEDGS